MGENDLVAPAELLAVGHSNMLSHPHNLRADLPVTIDLPTDLTKNEAERLASFIRTLPIEEEA